MTVKLNFKVLGDSNDLVEAPTLASKHSANHHLFSGIFPNECEGWPQNQGQPKVKRTRIEYFKIG
jgi:hypothetical protein